MSHPTVRNHVLLRSEESGGVVSFVENTMPAGSQGPPLHSHVLDGELTVQLGNRLATARAGDLLFAPRNLPHTLANLGQTAARFLLIITPAGFEREFARRAANEAGIEPPAWALQPLPEVTYLGPRINER